MVVCPKCQFEFAEVCIDGKNMVIDEPSMEAVSKVIELVNGQSVFMQAKCKVITGGSFNKKEHVIVRDESGCEFAFQACYIVSGENV